MGTLKKLFGMGLSLFMDTGTGVIAVHTVSAVFGRSIEWYDYLIGIFFAVMPDSDMFIPLIVEFTGGDESDSSHKALPTHYPLFMVPFIGGLALLVSPLFYGSLVVTCLLAHFFHDSWQSQENGPGVRWLAPFGKRYYQLLSRHAQGEPLKLVLVVSPERVERAFEETLEEWLESIFFQFTWENTIGIATFTVSICLATHNLLR